MSWNGGQMSKPQWNGNGNATTSRILNVSTITADEIFTKDLYANYISTGSLFAQNLSTTNGSIGFLSNLVLKTGVIELGVSPTYLTAEAGVLYVNGDAVAFPSSFSTIADWSQFKAVANVDMSRSSIYNVRSISTNSISTGLVLAGSISTNNLASRNIGANNISTGFLLADTINSRAAIITTLTGTDMVYGNGILGNLSSSNILGRNIFSSNIVNSNILTTAELDVDYLSAAFIVAKTANIDTLFNSTITGYKGIFQSTAVGFLIANNISTGFIKAANGLYSLLQASNLSTLNTDASTLNARVLRAGTAEVETLLTTRDIVLSPPQMYPDYDSNILYAPGTSVTYNLNYYEAVVSNLNVPPSGSIPLWINGGTYNVYNYVFVTGVASYRCIRNVSGSIIPPNSDHDNWEYFSDTNVIFQIWSYVSPPSGSGIVGNITSYINVGSITASNINVSSLVLNNFSTSNITSYNITNSNLLSNAGDAQFNTLTTSGALTTNNALNLNGGLFLNSDIEGSTCNYASIDGTQTRFFDSINNILNLNTNALNVVGCGTGNTVLPPYRNNSIVNIGETEFSPGVVSIYGVNAELTTALTVYGLTSLNGDTTINGLNTVNGFTDLNGDLTVIGLTTITGDTDITGLTSITGNTDINGACQITGETNILGLLTAEAGIGVLGAMTFQAGVIEIGDPMPGVTNNFGFYCYYSNAYFENLNVNLNANFQQNVNVNGILTANTINLNSTTSRLANISTLFVSSLIGYKGLFDSISTNYISSGIINAGRGLFNSLSTINISTGSLKADIITTAELLTESIGNPNPFGSFPINVNNALNLGENNIFNVGSLTANNISTVLISTGLINSGELDVIVDNEFALAAGNIIVLSQNGTSIQDNATVNITAESQLTLTSIASDITIEALGGNTTINANILNLNNNLTNINSLTDINLNTTNGYTYIGYASTASLNTSTINFDNATGQFVSLQAPPDDAAGLIFYRTIDGVQEPDTFIVIQNSIGFNIQSISTIAVTAPNEIAIDSGKRLGLSGTDFVVVDTPVLVVNSNATISSINTRQITTSNVSSINIEASYANIWDITSSNISTTSVYANELYTYYLGNPFPFTQLPIKVNNALDLQANSIYNITQVSTGSLLAGSVRTPTVSTNILSTGSLLAGSVRTPTVSTNILSTGTILTNFITGAVNVNFGKSIIPSGNLDIGASGAFRWNNLWVSTISSIHTQSSTITVTNRITTSTVTTSNIETRRISRPADMVGQVPTTDLEPATGNVTQLGYPFNGNFNGFFSRVCAISTITSNIVHPLGDDITSSIRVLGTLSTQNLMVSTINRKLYPYTSTLNIPFSTFSITGNQAGTPILLYSNIQFLNQGFHRISQKAILSKNSGGSSQDIHANIFYTVGAFPSTPSITDGYSALAYANDDARSTFTTLMTEFYVSTPTTRNILYYDSAAKNYTARLYMGTLFDTYTPQFGLNPERIQANIL